MNRLAGGRGPAAALCAAAWIALAAPAVLAAPASPAAAPRPRTPIEHVIVVVGENQSFDGVFATYTAPPGESVRNLLSEGIVRADGTPGRQYARAVQSRARSGTRFEIDPPRAGTYEHLPQPTITGVLDLKQRYIGTGPDARFPADLPPGPFQISRYVDWPQPHARAGLGPAIANLGAATGDPVHRFFQMWQQTGGDNARLDLYVWPAVTAGMGGDTEDVAPGRTGQGGEPMGFVNIAAGDAPVFLDLARHYAMSDNYHQAIIGGTGANFFALVTAGDVAFYNEHGKLATPPANQIENPDPVPGSENFYRRDGYSGGSYVECANAAAPGVAPIRAVLARAHVASRCEPGHYYLVNNYYPAYDINDHLQPLGPNNYILPPQTVRTFAEALADAGVSWAWYMGAREPADLTEEMRLQNITLDVAQRQQYNVVGDALATSAVVMTRPELRAHLTGLTSFDVALANNTLPAVSFLEPKNLDSGHPGYSALTSYESFLAGIVAAVKSHPELWAHTAIVATVDEGGGHFDSGYIQILDFFGDGPRIPLLVISPYARAGHIDHTYTDHASILKFIEYNWGLKPLTARSRDNFPNPAPSPGDPYRPRHAPAIGDLTTLFEFPAAPAR